MRVEEDGVAEIVQENRESIFPPRNAYMLSRFANTPTILFLPLNQHLAENMDFCILSSGYSSCLTMH